MSLLAAPKYFKLKETPVDTVLVTEGVYRKTSQSEKYGNDQYYFLDRADKKLKCLSGGVLGAVITNNELNVNASEKPVQIIYKGVEIMESGKFKGKEAHQFEVNPVGWGLEEMGESTETDTAPTTTDDTNLDDLA